jgi:hypothetical protein
MGMEVGQLGGGTTIALILIMSFAIDRTVAGLMFYFSYKGWVQDPSELLNNPPDQEKTDEGTVEGEEGEAKEREAEKREAERREAQLQAKKRYKLWWFRLTLVFVLPILCLEKYRILTAMGIRQP